MEVRIVEDHNSGTLDDKMDTFEDGGMLEVSMAGGLGGMLNYRVELQTITQNN